MNKLERHISHLLSSNDCVIVPGIGAFLAHRVPARYLSDEQIFMPPHRTLGFNPQVKVDDALLVSSYIKEEKLSYSDAYDVMQKDISMLNANLSQNGTVRFGALGTFSMDINNNILFEPDSNGIDDPYNYGFETLSIARLQSRKEKTITIKRKELGRYIAAAAAVILTFLFVTPISDRAYESNLKASLSNFASSEQISMMQQLTTTSPATVESPADCNIYPVTSTSEDAATPASTAIAPKATESVTATVAVEAATTATETGKKHYIIVASSPTAENAQLAISELTRKMKADYTVVVCGKRHRVAIEAFSTESEAQDALPRIQTTFPDAWVLTH